MSRNRAELRAEEILEEFSLDCAPTDPHRVAQALGVRVVFDRLEDGVSGMLYRESDPPLILINEDDHRNRQRFSLAHELAHFVLHTNSVFVDSPMRRDTRSSLAVDSLEIQANAFAAAFLMPREWVIRELVKISRSNPQLSDEEMTDTLAEQFEVSRAAMGWRLMNLGLVGTV